MNCPFCQIEISPCKTSTTVYNIYDCNPCKAHIYSINNEISGIYISYLLYTIKILIPSKRMILSDSLIMFGGFTDLEFPTFPLNLPQILSQVDRIHKLKAFL